MSPRPHRTLQDTCAGMLAGWLPDPGRKALRSAARIWAEVVAAASAAAGAGQTSFKTKTHTHATNTNTIRGSCVPDMLERTPFLSPNKHVWRLLLPFAVDYCVLHGRLAALAVHSPALPNSCSPPPPAACVRQRLNATHHHTRVSARTEVSSHPSEREDQALLVRCSSNALPYSVMLVLTPESE